MPELAGITYENLPQGRYDATIDIENGGLSLKRVLRIPGPFTNYADAFTKRDAFYNALLAEGAYPGTAIPIKTVRIADGGLFISNNCVTVHAGAVATDHIPIPTDKEGWIFVVNYGSYSNSDGKSANNTTDVNIPNGVNLTVQEDFGSQVIATPAEGLVWETGKVPLDVESSIHSRGGGGTISVTWRNTAALSPTKLDEYVGAINSVVFLGHTAETVMFNGVQEQTQYKISGSPDQNLTLSFGIKRVRYNAAGDIGGWNHFPRPNTPQLFDRVFQRTAPGSTAASFEPLHPLKDLYGIFS